MRKHIFKSVIAMLVVALLVAIGVDTSGAHQYTYTAGTAYKVTLPNGSFLYRFQFQGNGTHQQDTLIINLPATKYQDMFKSASDTSIFLVNVYTSDSAVVGMRYQISSDGTTYKSFTVGTDSTSYACSTYDAGTTITLNSVLITGPQYTSPQPYNRLMVVGVKHASRAAYGWVGIIKVDVIPLHQE